MSCCLILQEKNKIFMGSDSALSTKIGDLYFRVSNNQKKIFEFKNGIIFCSGNILFVHELIKYLGNILNLESVTSFLKNKNFIIKEDLFNIEVMAYLFETPNIVYQISEYNNFEIITHIGEENSVRVLSGGINSKKCNDYACLEVLKNNGVLSLYQNTFDYLSDEKIGGILNIYEVGLNVKSKHIKKINEKDIRYLESHSLIADVIVGKLLASNALWIENENNSFKVTGDGIFARDAFIDITGSNSKILLDPNTGISISKRDPITNQYTDKRFYVDTNGNVIFAGTLKGADGEFSGKISATSGEIGMWNIDKFGLFDDANANYIYGDGRIRLGKLTINGSEADFDGTFHARNLGDNETFDGTQLSDINADTITAGTITGIDIYGSNIYWPGVRMYSPIDGRSLIQADNQIAMSAGNSYVTITPTTANIAGNVLTTMGNITNIGTISLFASQLNVIDADYNSGTGISGTFVI